VAATKIKRERQTVRPIQMLVGEHKSFNPLNPHPLDTNLTSTHLPSSSPTVSKTDRESSGEFCVASGLNRELLESLFNEPGTERLEHGAGTARVRRENIARGNEGEGSGFLFFQVRGL